MKASTKNLAQRVALWSVLAFVDFKKLGASLHSHVSKASQYASNLLKISPNRKVVYCALTNYFELIFVAAYMTTEANGVQVIHLVHSGEINSRELGNINTWTSSLV